MALEPGTRLGGYEIQDELGSGGMGRVYRARDIQLGREVAIKVLSEATARNPEGVRRLLAEARATSALNHPNILTVHGVGEADGAPYVVTELVQGETLRALVARGPLAPEHAVGIALQVLSGLGKAHGIGIVHRDLKPENLMLTSDGIVKILDFGLAKLVDTGAAGRVLDSLGGAATATGLVMGTASYMSPEQARGLAASPRSDLFALGVILYEMLTGVNPFQRASIADTLSALLRDQPPHLSAILPALPPELARCVDRLLDKDPEARPASAREVESVLAPLRGQLRGQSASATILSIPPLAFDRVPTGPDLHKSGLARARRRWPRLAAALVAVVALAALGWVVLGGRDGAVPASPFAAGSQVVAVMSIDDRTNDAELARADVGRILADAFVQILYDCQGVQVVSPARIQSLVMGERRTYLDTGRDWDLARKVCREAGANTVLSGALSRLGTSLVLNATLTEITTGRLVGSFEARAMQSEELLEALSMNIAPKMKTALGSMSGVQIVGGRPVGEIVTQNFQAYLHLTRGMDFNNVGNFDDAVPELEKAIELDPELALGWTELMCSYSFLGEEQHAQAALQRARALSSRLSRKEQLWVEVNSLWLAGNGGPYRQKMEEYLKEFPDDRQAAFYIGLSWEWLDEDCQQARAAYEKAYRLTPEYWPITKGIADCSQKLKDVDGARRALERYINTVKRGYGVDDARNYLQSLPPANAS